MMITVLNPSAKGHVQHTIKGCLEYGHQPLEDLRGPSQGDLQLD